MTLGPPTSSAICLNLTSGPTPSVTIHPTALFSILDHYLRRTDTQRRVIGTLLGTRSEGDDTISVRNAFAVLHSETSEQVAVDMDYHRAMFELSQRVSPKESIVGWCVPPFLHKSFSASPSFNCVIFPVVCPL
jgi:translation initiation factor 3 subunit F